MRYFKHSLIICTVVVICSVLLTPELSGATTVPISNVNASKLNFALAHSGVGATSGIKVINGNSITPSQISSNLNGTYGVAKPGTASCGGLCFNTRFGTSTYNPVFNSVSFDSCWSTVAYQYDGFGATWVFSNSVSNNDWLGNSPSNASYLNGEFDWWVNGIDVSVSIPPSIGFSGSNNEVVWRPGEISNYWQYNMNSPENVNIWALETNSVNINASASYWLYGYWYGPASC